MRRGFAWRDRRPRASAPASRDTMRSEASWATRLRGMALVAFVSAPGLWTAWSVADAQMLYEDRLADGYAYVRFVNATPNGMTLKPIGFADPLSLGTSGADRVSAYYTVEKVAKRTLTVRLDGGKQLDFELTPGAFQTVLIERSGAGISEKIVIDQMELSQTKARLSFYNAAPSCMDAALYLEPKGQPVFEGVGPNLMRGRAVNPARDPRVRAGCGPERLASLDLGPLDAGGQYSVWLIAPAGAPTTFLSKNTIAPYLR